MAPTALNLLFHHPLAVRKGLLGGLRTYALWTERICNRVEFSQCLSMTSSLSFLTPPPTHIPNFKPSQQTQIQKPNKECAGNECMG